MEKRTKSIDLIPRKTLFKSRVVCVEYKVDSLFSLSFNSAQFSFYTIVRVKMMEVCIRRTVKPTRQKYLFFEDLKLSSTYTILRTFSWWHGMVHKRIFHQTISYEKLSQSVTQKLLEKREERVCSVQFVMVNGNIKLGNSWWLRTVGIDLPHFPFS